MNIDREIEQLKKNIKEIYFGTCKQIKENIYRGHKRSISTDIEDNIDLFISAILPNDYKFFLDSTIRIEKKSHRPDLLIIDGNDNVTALIEIKANMGWCRNANEVINKLIDTDKLFKNKTKLCCKLSEENSRIVYYGNNVKLFLVSLTTGNCKKYYRKNNKEYAQSFNIFHFNLFEEWYDSLKNYEIYNFVDKIFH